MLRLAAPLSVALAAFVLSSGSARAEPYELSYTVTNSFSTIYEETDDWSLYWPINGTDGLAWDGEGVWASSCDSMLLAKFDPETGDVIDEIEYPEDAHHMMVDHMAWDGQYLWGNVHSMPGDPEPHMGHLIAIDTATGDVAKKIEVPFRDADSMTPMGTAWDGEYLWTQDPRYGEYYRIDPETGEGADTPYWDDLRFNNRPIYPCGVSHDDYSCMWISDLNKGYYIQVDIETGEVVSYLEPPDNPDPDKYGEYRPDSVTKLFTGMTTDGRRVWVVDELEGNPILYQLDVDFPNTGLCAHPVENGETCVPDGEPFCFSESACAGDSGAEVCTPRCDVAGQECGEGFECSTTAPTECVEVVEEGCAGCATGTDTERRAPWALWLLGGLAGLVVRRR